MPELTEIPRWILEVVFVLYVIIVSGFVVLERRKPTATLAIILALAFVPIVGLGAYLLLSRRRVRKRLVIRRKRPVNPVDETRHIAKVDAIPKDMPAAQRGLVRVALQSAAAPLRHADSVVLLSSGQEALEGITRAINAATRSIHMEFYIWHDDEVGRMFTELLAKRAREGIRVRVLYDHVGSFGLANEHFAPLVQAGGEVASFGRLYVLLRRDRSRLNFRNHRKLVTIDGCIGFVGGLNIGAAYFGTAAQRPGWRDLLVQLQGDAVVGLEAIFLEDWFATTGGVIDLEGSQRAQARGSQRGASRFRPRMKDRRRIEAANPFAPLPARPRQSEGPLVQIIPSGPDIQVASSIAAQFSAAIASAQSRAWIATPYFIPDEPLSLILRTAALRGVDVRIMVPDPKKNDQWLTALASRSYYDELLEVGVQIYEYLPGMLHSKYLITDDVSAIGSANMDIRSFHINYEITAMFYDANVTAALAAVFLDDLQDARQVTAADRMDLRLGSRLVESFARVLSPLL